MEVQMKKITSPITIGTKGNGVVFQVKDGDKHLGDLVVTRSRMEWCPGRTKEGNGYPVPWRKLKETLKKGGITKSRVR